MSLGTAWNAGDGEGARSDSEIQAFVGLLRRRKYVVASIVMVAAIGAAGLVSITAPVFEGRALIRADSSAARSGTAADQREASIGLANTQAKVITDAGFLTEAAVALGIPYDELYANISAAVVPETELIRVKGTAGSQDEARVLVQRFAEYAVDDITSGYEKSAELQVAALREQRDILQKGRSDKLAQQRQALARGDTALSATLETEIADLGGQIGQIDVQISQTIASGPLQSASVSLVSPATASGTQISPRPLRSVGLGVVLGLILGIAFAWLLDQLDRRVRTLAEVEALAGGLILGTIPITRSSDPRALSALENAFDFVRVNLGLAPRDGVAPAIAITSSTESEGKTFVTLEFAKALARAGRSVVVIDADLRRRTLSLRTGSDRKAGLGDVLRGDVPAERAVHPLGEINVMPAGPPTQNPSPLLDSRMFEDALEQVRRRYDFILIDTPPAAHIADATIIGRRVDGTVIVARLGVAERNRLRATIGLFRQEVFNLLGVIVQSEAETLRADYYYTPPRKGGLLRRTPKRERPANVAGSSRGKS
jgi:capsular exopolysaccharide synthesis family protein